MKNLLAILLILCTIACTHQKNVPDVSNIKIQLTTQRFEKDFFALDTNKADVAIQQLYNKYNNFCVDFFQNILGSSSNPDTTIKLVKLFSKAYSNVYTDANNYYPNITNEETEIKKAFQFVQYYFPKYKLPTKLNTYIGPWDAIFMLSTKSSGSGVFLDEDNIGIGLQLALGNNYNTYQQPFFKEAYPDYISKRFTKNNIPVNVLKVIVDDLYPNKAVGKPLIEQMIDAGKRLYLLDAFMPYTADSLKTGYTQKQLDGCFKNEANIWSFFVTNDLLYSNEMQIIRDYMNDAPNTQVLGEASPGFIGQFVGWQIVKKWMSKNEKTSLQQLLAKSTKEIFEESKYKP